MNFIHNGGFFKFLLFWNGILSLHEAKDIIYDADRSTEWIWMINRSTIIFSVEIIL